MIDLLAQAAFVAVVSTLVSESMIMSTFRDKIDTLASRLPSRIGPAVGYFVSCPICMGIWLAVPFLQDGFLHYFLVIAVSNVWMLVILKVYNELEG